jgi:diguanylate cyclase (GGDEF)-like protein
MMQTALTSHRRKFLIASIFIAILLLGAAALSQNTWQLFGFAHKHNAIQELQDVAPGPVHLEGVVTYIDQAGKRFWIQDDTGAIAIQQDPSALNIHAHQAVLVDARKTQLYNSSLGLASIELKDVVVTHRKKYRDIPEAIQVTLATLPGIEKDGVEVEMKGVVHAVTTDKSGRLNITVGDSLKEITVVAPGTSSDFSRWANAAITLQGVIETKIDEEGTPLTRQIWVQEPQDIQVSAEKIPSPALYSLRQLYSSPEAQNGHTVRLRGQIVARQNANTWLLENQFGGIACSFDDDRQLSPGKEVEVTGFPVQTATFSRELDLDHATAAFLKPGQKNNEEFEKDQNVPPVTNLASLRDLTTAQAAEALPIRISGIITSPQFGERHTVFVQDASTGTYVQFSGPRPHLDIGEKVTLIAITGPGPFTPEILAAKFILHGKTELPKSVQLNAQNVSTGELTAQFVEVEGIVHPLKPSPRSQFLHYFDLDSSFGVIRIGSPFDETYLRGLEDATVRIRGIYIPLFNSQRQMTGRWVLVEAKEYIQVLQSPVGDPFQQKATPISQLLYFSPQGRFAHRVKVQGNVTMVGAGFYYVQDETGGAEVLGETRNLKPGDLVEVAGYAAPGAYSPILRDAIARVSKHDVQSPIEQTSAQSLAEGHADSKLVSVVGTLLSSTNSPTSRSLVLQSNGQIFNATLHLTSGQYGSDLEEGSTLRLIGISSVQPELNNVDAIVQPAGFKFLVRSPEDIQVLRRAPWWSFRNTIRVVAILVGVILIGLVWLQALRRRLFEQNAELRHAEEKAKAVRNLATAMQDVTLRKNFLANVAVPSDEEIAVLSTEFNKMISELHSRDLKLQSQALTDELTGLPNRRLLSDRLSQALQSAKRDNRILALLYLDLDGFKLVNDSLGHSTGDALLGQVTERLRSRIRKSDTLARLGGDEFTLLLTKLNNRDEAGLVAQSLLEVLSKPFQIESHEVTISASIGISIFPENGADASQLLQQADSAMYAAKRNGKNQMLYFSSEQGSQVRERLTLENQLRGAIARGEISVFYQPEFDIATQRLIRFEALARWNHPTLGNIPPDRFIPVAEESGLIVPLGAYILERACTEALRWQKVAKEPVQVAVNVSSVQFSRETFVNEVIDIVRHTGLPPHLLQIELTESVMLSGTEPAAETMRQLRAAGISIAIDDFGTGYSCFGYLPRLPFNALKIDRMFVKELETRPEMKAMVHSLVTLAHNLSMQVIVEGIETPEQLQMIKALGGNEVQGYLMGRPTPDPMAQLTGLSKSPVDEAVAKKATAASSPR